MRGEPRSNCFAQLMDHLPSYEFQKCVARYCGDAHGRGFSCRDQYLAMAFAQLTYRESLRRYRSLPSGDERQAVSHMGFRGRMAFHWLTPTMRMTGVSTPISRRS